MSNDATQLFVLGMQGEMSLLLSVLRASSLCPHLEGHKHWEPLYPTVSHKHFQEEMISDDSA